MMFAIFAVLAVVKTAGRQRARRAAHRYRYQGRHWTPLDDQWAAAIRSVARRRTGATT
jgi:hypothetical protein